MINFGGCKYLVLMIDSNGKYLLLIQSMNLATISIFVYIGLLYFKSYLGLLSFIIPTLISIFIILSIIKKRYSVNIREYFHKTNSSKIFILDLLLFVEILFLIFSPQYTFYILGISFAYFLHDFLNLCRNLLIC